MIHTSSKSGTLHEESQAYDAHGRANYAVDRGELNAALLNELEGLKNVKLCFNHKLIHADLKKKEVTFEHSLSRSKADRQDVTVPFDLLIGADGAHSVVRYHMMKYVRMDYAQTYIDNLWCEFTIRPRPSADANPNSKFAIDPNHLHIWPSKQGREEMFIAIPSTDGSFTCTLFMPSGSYAELEAHPDRILKFFDTHFPGVSTLIPGSDLVDMFNSNPHLPLISIICSPHHCGSSAVVVGDAAHAMVPFYGQGMNAGLEDVRVLFEMLDKHTTSDSSASEFNPQVAAALNEYTAMRIPDAHAINQLALDNYTEMRSGVVSRTYKLRKSIEEFLYSHCPSLGWATKYSRVSFGNERYSEVVKRSELQGWILGWAAVGLVALPVLVGVWWGRWRWRVAKRSTRFLARKGMGLGTAGAREGWRWLDWF
jgi:kynurenine 3-monooxygenase